MTRWTFLEMQKLRILALLAACATISPVDASTGTLHSTSGPHLQNLSPRGHPYQDQFQGFDPLVHAWQPSPDESCGFESRSVGTFCYPGRQAEDGSPGFKLQRYYWQLCVHTSTLERLDALGWRAVHDTSPSSTTAYRPWTHLHGPEDFARVGARSGSCPDDHLCLGHGYWMDKPAPLPFSTIVTVADLAVLLQQPRGAVMCVPSTMAAVQRTGTKRGHGHDRGEGEGEGGGEGGNDKRQRSSIGHFGSTSTGGWS